MLRWMCGVTKKDLIRNKYIRRTTRVTYGRKKITETSDMVWACYEKGQGAHGEKRTDDRHSRKKTELSTVVGACYR